MLINDTDDPCGFNASSSEIGGIPSEAHDECYQSLVYGRVYEKLKWSRAQNMINVISDQCRRLATSVSKMLNLFNVSKEVTVTLYSILFDFKNVQSFPSALYGLQYWKECSKVENLEIFEFAV